MKLAVFLNGVRGLHTLQALAVSEHTILAAVTPDPAGTVAGSIDTLGVPHLPLTDINSVSSCRKLAKLGADLFVIAGYSAIFREPVIALPRLGVINLHAGRLPQYRGGSPLNWQILNGEAQAGISVLRVDGRIDAGPVLASALLPIGPRETIASLHEAANGCFPSLVLNAIKRVEHGETGDEQDETQAQYWCQRNDADGHLAPHLHTAAQADRMIRALTRPYPGTWCRYGDRKVRLLAAQLPDFVLRGPAGRICHIEGKGPYLICADRGLLITDYIIENGGAERLRHGQYLT